MKDIFAFLGIILIVAFVIIGLDLLIFTINDISDKYKDNDWLDYSLILNTAIAIVAVTLLIAKKIGLVQI